MQRMSPLQPLHDNWGVSLDWEVRGVQLKPPEGKSAAR